MTLFWLAVLGWLTYIILKRSVPSLVGGRIWVLWLVMMTPALIWTGWSLFHQGEQQIPPLLILGPFLVCPLIYLVLLALWRPTPKDPNTSSAAPLPAVNARETETSRGELPQRRPEITPPKPPLNSEEEAQLRQCFSWSTYFLNKIEYRLQAVICQGQLKTSPEQAYGAIEQNVQRTFGDRFLLLLQEDLSGKPFFALVPNPQAKRLESQLAEDSQPYRYGLALGLLGLTLLTTTLVGLGFVGSPITSLTELTQQPDLLLKGLPYALPLLIILGIHEGGHFLAARRYRLKTSLPYFIPIPAFLGTFGAFIQIRSPMPNRKILFDVGIAGPLAGLVVTVPFLLWGLAHSQVVPADTEAGLLQFDALNPQISILLMLLSRWLLGSDVTWNAAIAMHPVAIAGYLGLIVTALNLMPIGQLDGGHMVHAMFGQKTGAIIGQVARLLVLMLSFVQKELLVWAILLFFIPAVDEPALNDVSELNNARDGLGLLTLALLLLIVLPMPPVLANLFL